MAFTGWPIEAVEFFEGLEADNTKAYWADHKPVYENHVRVPMQALLDDLSGTEGAGKIFRPYRDVRFSGDKTPYKTNIAATLDNGGYVSFDADGFSCGTGYYMMAKDQLAAFRTAIDADATGTALETIVEGLTVDGIEVTAHDTLKTAPRGYPKDHPRIELLRMKGCIAWRRWDVGAWLDTPEAKDRVQLFLDHATPLVDWLDTNVGPSELEGGWG